MSPERIVFIISIVLVSISTLLLIYRKLPKRLKHDKFYEKWKSIQKQCADKENWRQVIIEADDLLDKALKKKKIKGSSMGERMVAAQNLFVNNDSVWFGHKLRTKIEADPERKITQDETKKALLGIGQGLKDLGALK
jgi:hypothetical protein